MFAMLTQFVLVALRAGAWIETTTWVWLPWWWTWSPSVLRCGLKRRWVF